MAVETKLDLNKNSIEGLEQLVQMNIDSAEGFEFTAERIKSSVLKDSFEEIGEERRQQANELSMYLSVNDHAVKQEGSFAAALHRSWIKCREFLASNDLHALVAEAERGEDAIKGAYEEVLLNTAGSAVNDVLTQHHSRVKQTHDQIRDLRDSLSSVEA